MYCDEPTIVPDPTRDDQSEFILVGPHAWLTIGDASVYLEAMNGRLVVRTWPRHSENPDPSETVSITLPTASEGEAQP